MTREEAIAYFKDMNDCTYGDVEPIQMAIKALEQEPVLDKIKAEIEELDERYVIGDYGIYGENIPKYVRFCDVLKIIDKYKAESEGEE